MLEFNSDGEGPNTVITVLACTSCFINFNQLSDTRHQAAVTWK